VGADQVVLAGRVRCAVSEKNKYGGKWRLIRRRGRISCALVLAALLCGCGTGREAARSEAGQMSVIPSVTVGGTGQVPVIPSVTVGGTGQVPAVPSVSLEEAGQVPVMPSVSAGDAAQRGEKGNFDSAADGQGQDAVTGLDGGPRESLETPEISLVMVGDILLHTPVAESGWNGEEYDFSAVFAGVKEEIQEADLALVNQEVILGGEELGISGYPAFNAPYELGDALAEAGFDVVLHATNHALDKGKRGVENCLSFWQESHPEMAVLGIHGSEAAQQEIYVYEQEGIRVAILNYTYGTNGIALPEDMPYAVDLLVREQVEADLHRAGELADFVIVCPHWGTEYVLDAVKEQEDWAEFFVQNGADLVLGTHPHVIEPVVWVETGDDVPDGDAGTDAAGTDDKDKRHALVYYSLGNFVNWTSGTGSGVADRMVGGMAQVVIGLDEDGQAFIRSYGVEPLVCHVEQGFGGVTVYPLADYTEELAARNEIVKQDAGFTLDYCRKLAENVFGTLAENIKTVSERKRPE